MGINEWKAANFYHVYIKKKETSRIQREGSSEFVWRSVWLLDGDFRDVALCCFAVRGETYSVPDCPTHMFSKIHVGVTVYLFNILSSGSSSHSYLKDII